MPGSDINVVIEAIDAGIRRFYDERDSPDSFDVPIDTWDVLASLGGIEDYAITEYVVDQIGLHDWVPSARSGRDEAETLGFGRDSFEHHVRHVSRYLLAPSQRSGHSDEGALGPGEVLPAIADIIRSENLFTTLERRPWIFRARTCNDHSDIRALRELVAPPPMLATQGRMNAAGIPVLYGALEEATAAAEVYDGKPCALIVTLAARRELTLLDLTQIPGASPYDPSIPAQRISRLGFLRGFARRIAQPIIRDDRVHHEYAPTQMASEFFRWKLKPDAPIDGIVYPSSKGEGHNVVVFVGHQACLADEDLSDGEDRAPGNHQLFNPSNMVSIVRYEAPRANPAGKLFFGQRTGS